MKCAKEFILVKEEAIAKRDAEERQKDLEAMELYRKRCVNTIAFCDTFIDEKLTGQAKACNPIRIKIAGYFNTDRIKNECFIPYSYDACLDIKTLKKYLEQHCLVCEFKKEPYSYKRGKSTTHGERDVLVIYVPNGQECAK